MNEKKWFEGPIAKVEMDEEMLGQHQQMAIQHRTPYEQYILSRMFYEHIEVILDRGWRFSYANNHTSPTDIIAIESFFENIRDDTAWKNIKKELELSLCPFGLFLYDRSAKSEMDNAYMIVNKALKDKELDALDELISITENSTSQVVHLE